MNRRASLVLVTLGCIGAAVSAEQARAQGLIWSLPPDGSWVRYEGTYGYDDRTNGSIGDIEPWTRSLWIGSVGTETAEFNGQMVPCRWIEIQVTTGRPSEAGLDPGPLGPRTYRVLVPESEVVGKLVHEQIPVSMIPIAKGYRKLGQEPVEEMGAKVLQVYPVICLLQHYRDWQAVTGQPEDPGIRLGAIQAVKHQASKTMESPTARSTGRAEVWRSDEVPFGVAKWSVTVLRETKDSIQPRSEFKPVSQISERMEAVETGTDAQNRTRLQVPGR